MSNCDYICPIMTTYCVSNYDYEYNVIEHTLHFIIYHTVGGQKSAPPPHYNTVVVYKRQKVPKQYGNIHGAVQINSK